MTSTTNSTNRFLEVLNGFSDRKTQKRSREEAIDHFVETTAAVLYTSSTPTPLAKRGKRITAHVDKDATVQKDTDKAGSSLQYDDDDDDDDLWKGDMKYYQKCLEKEKEDLNKIDETRNVVLQEIVDVWGVYKYGLIRIGALADLSEAPDAIMPGNF